MRKIRVGLFALAFLSLVGMSSAKEISYEAALDTLEKQEFGVFITEIVDRAEFVDPAYGASLPSINANTERLLSGNTVNYSANPVTTVAFKDSTMNELKRDYLWEVFDETENAWVECNTFEKVKVGKYRLKISYTAELTFGSNWYAYTLNFLPLTLTVKLKNDVLSNGQWSAEYITAKEEGAPYDIRSVRSTMTFTKEYVIGEPTPHKLTVSVNDDELGSFVFQVNEKTVSTAKPGDYVYIVPTYKKNNAGCKSVVARAANGDSIVVSENLNPGASRPAYFSFQMPGNDVSVNIEMDEFFNIEVSSEIAFPPMLLKSGSIGSKLYFEKDTVRFFGANIQNLRVVDSNGMKIPVIDDYGTKKFVMPASDVRVVEAGPEYGYLDTCKHVVVRMYDSLGTTQIDGAEEGTLVMFRWDVDHNYKFSAFNIIARTTGDYVFGESWSLREVDGWLKLRMPADSVDIQLFTEPSDSAKFDTTLTWTVNTYDVSAGNKNNTYNGRFDNLFAIGEDTASIVVEKSTPYPTDVFLLRSLDGKTFSPEFSYSQPKMDDATLEYKIGLNSCSGRSDVCMNQYSLKTNDVMDAIKFCIAKSEKRSDIHKTESFAADELLETFDMCTYTGSFFWAYRVTFLDFDDKVLDSQHVEYGHSATAPTAPTRSGYTFTGWDVNFSNIVKETKVTAQYVSIASSSSEELNSSSSSSGKAKSSSSYAYSSGRGNSSTSSSSSSSSEYFPSSDDKDEISSSGKAKSSSSAKATSSSGKAKSSSSAKAKSSSSSAKAKSSSSKGKDAIHVVASIPHIGIMTVARDILVSGANVGSAYSVFDMQGRLMVQGRVESANFRLTMPRAGSYVLRIDSQIQRVTLR